MCCRIPTALPGQKHSQTWDMSWFILNFGRTLVTDEKCVGREKSNGESFSIHIREGRTTVSLKEIFLTNSCNMFHVLVQGTRQGGQIHKVKLWMSSLETFTAGLPTFVEAISYSPGIARHAHTNSCPCKWTLQCRTDSSTMLLLLLLPYRSHVPFCAVLSCPVLSTPVNSVYRLQTTQLPITSQPDNSTPQSVAEHRLLGKMYSGY